MTTEDLMKLRELAEAATPGEWIVNDVPGAGIEMRVPYKDSTRLTFVEVWRQFPEKEWDKELWANATFIAAANPAKVIELLDALEALGQEVAIEIELRGKAEQGLVDWAVKYANLEAEVAAIRATDKDAGLVAALKDAATSLETISRLAGHTHYVGDDGERIETYMGRHDEVRGYATSRASKARAALSKLGGV